MSQQLLIEPPQSESEVRSTEGPARSVGETSRRADETPAPPEASRPAEPGFLARQFGARRVVEKVRRRVRNLIGRPDNTPWVLDPPARKRTAHVDFMFGLDYLSPNARLCRIFQEKLGAYGMSVQLVNKSNVEQVTRDIESGWLRPHVYLDLCCWPGDPFAKLLYAAARAGVQTLRDVRHTKWVMKAQGHPELERAGLPVPPSVIFHRDDPDRELTAEERERVGERCVIKPSASGLGKGVVLNVAPTRENIAKARDADRSNEWLVQRMMKWGKLDNGHDAYLRGYGVGGHRTLLWWEHSTTIGHGGYRPLTWRDLERYQLYDAVQLVERIQRVTGMDFFSVEIAITNTEPGARDRLCLIDYLNDQCDLDFEAHPEWSVPEPFTKWACERLAELVWRKKSGTTAAPQSGLFLLDE